MRKVLHVSTKRRSIHLFSDRRKLIRNGTMILGILALAPPVGFLAQLFGGTMLCGNLCSRMAIGPGFISELFTRTAGVVLLFVWLGITFFFGRWLCSHFCPVGALTDFAARLVPKRLKIDYCKIVDAPLFRYGFLGAFILMPVLGFASICCAYCSWSVIPEVFGAIFVPRLRLALVTGTKAVSILLYVGLLGILSRDGRGHCHLVCPVGALDSIVNFIGARLPFTWRLRVNTERCSGCKLCEEACSANAIRFKEDPSPDSGKIKPVAVIDYHRCYQCRACESRCNRDALQITRPVAEKGKEIWIQS